MKVISALLFYFFINSSLPIFGQQLNKDFLEKREATEIAYIKDCIINNSCTDNLIGWKLSSEYENFIIYKFKSRLAFFKIQKDTKGEQLQSITYNKNSFQKIIYFNDTISTYEITSQTRFKVWMAKDKLSVYFCVINPKDLAIWVLTNGNNVYAYRSALIQVHTNQVEVTNDSKH